MRYLLLAGAFTISFILGAGSAIAQEEEPDCKNPQGHLEIITCVGKLERESYQEMQAIYQKLQQQYQSQEQPPNAYHQKRLNYLIKSQEAWLEYRTAHCQWIASGFEGGSMQPIAGISCQAELNQQRIINLSKDL